MIFGVIEGLKQWRSVSQFQMCSRYSRTHWLTSAGSGFDAAGSMLEKYPVRLVCTSTSFVSCKVALFAHFETCLSRAPALPKKKKNFQRSPDRINFHDWLTAFRLHSFPLTLIVQVVGAVCFFHELCGRPPDFLSFKFDILPPNGD